jgi:hypothetical protein
MPTHKKDSVGSELVNKIIFKKQGEFFHVGDYKYYAL